MPKRLRYLPLTLFTWCLLAGAAHAQGAAEAAGGKSWVIGYALFALGIVLGIAIICAPSRRTAEAKRRRE